MDRRISRISLDLAHALANLQRCNRDPKAIQQRKYWRDRVHECREELREVCSELGVELVIADQLTLFDGDEE